MSIKITSKPLSGTVNPDKGQIEIFADSENGNHLTVITSGGTVYDLTKTSESNIESNIIEKTYLELTTMISNSELVPGFTYKINGVHKARTIDIPQIGEFPIKALYDDGRDLGTTIFLKAISENELETFGSGVFYNPKYDKQVQGFGIWSNKIEVTLSNINGTINGTFELADEEAVTADNGAKGIILTNDWVQYVAGDWSNARSITPISGDWSGASSITGDKSRATANIDNVIVPSYNAGDIVFWGGYAWKNLSGNTGTDTDILNLNEEWEKLNYDDVNYHKVVDYIEYDIENDIITRRYDTVNKIDVNSGLIDIVALNIDTKRGIDFSSISLMQWGNGLYIGSKGPVGVGNISVKHMSFIKLINFKDAYMVNVTLDNGLRSGSANAKYQT